MSLTRPRKSFFKGKLQSWGREISSRAASRRICAENNLIEIDFHVIISYGVSIAAVADNLIENVKYKVSEFTGLEIKKINIYVEGVRVID